MSGYKPISGIHQHLCAFHVYAHDRTRPVEAHHFCKHLTPDMHQCIVYDSNDQNARLIGIEYLITEKVFNTLPQEEKRYWHSHKYEIESGMLQLMRNDLPPGPVNDKAEQSTMLALHTTYGKTIHTWAIDIYPDLPLGAPQLMMSYTGDGQLDPKWLKARDDKYGMPTEEKRKLRKGYLPPYEKAQGSDAWETTGKGVIFDPVEQTVKF
ncbi:embryo-specific protein [Fomitiporia mediterranea MF3/22]|uniref:embryo-specific protein n=1 Tax=Fomitiporia mediterranea (strain MF3/22) TaxID=694068 RepID=UPI000440995B|nr:embryo-specific protein [Fomitiporia mediterranea MF3/22]EJD06856.1 embryo-specific protein [Fomitiporia mediterranea MF3/22]